MDGRRGTRRQENPPLTKIVGFELPTPSTIPSTTTATYTSNPPSTTATHSSNPPSSAASIQLPNAAASRQASEPVRVPTPQPPPESRDGFHMAHMDHGNSPRMRPPIQFPFSDTESMPPIPANDRGDGESASILSLVQTTLDMSLDDEQSAPATPGRSVGGTRRVSEEESAQSPLVSPRLKDVRVGEGDASGKPKPTKAERRALQEAQRAAKAAAKGGGKDVAGASGQVGPTDGKGAKKDGEKKGAANVKDKDKESVKGADKKKEVPAVRMQFDNEKNVQKVFGKSAVEQMASKNRLELFRHLPQFEHRAVMAATEAKFAKDDLHPAVYQLGLKYLNGNITGANARCVAMLLAFKQLVADYTTPPERTLPRDLTSRININVNFLITCRPLATSMGNAIKYLKLRIGELGKVDAPRMTEAEAKARIVEQIERFIQDKIVIAGQEIVKLALTKIRDGEVVLTYACSNVVELILKAAHTAKKNFRVIVVDSGPKLEGQELLRRLLQARIRCTYTQPNGLSYVMKEATRVLVGAASICANGCVVSRVGTADVGMVAHQFHVPVLVCCESYKFHESVPIDSICFNELGDPEEVVHKPLEKGPSELEGWEEIDNLQILNLTYDAMPAEYVDMIITELGMVPPTSVPVILREYRKEPVL